MRHFGLLILIFVTLLADSCTTKQTIVNLGDFLVADTMSETDVTLSIRRALEVCRQTKSAKLIIPKGRYRVGSNYAYEKYVFVSNNDPGLKYFLFDLSGMKNLEIDAQGSEFIFDGFVCPFVLDGSQNIVIKNLSIDYIRTFHSEGLITASGKGYVDVVFDKQFPYEITNGLLRFKDSHGVIYPYSNLLEFDSVRRETAFKVFDHWLWGGALPASEIGAGSVRVFKDDVVGTPGNIMVFGAANRLIPAFTISDSQGVLLSDVNIYHCGGMGVIAQRTKDIELNKVVVTPAPNSGRIISITADATHYVNCGGYLRMIDCTFENQKDDATNIHGIYVVVDRIISPTEVVVRLKHSQQYGFDFITTGTMLEFADQKSLIGYGEVKVLKAERLNRECTLVTFEQPIPAQTKLNDPLASTDNYPEVLISGCKIQKNRARGLLLGSRAKIVIENNYFHTPGAAILFEGDGNYWYEQSGVRGVVIRGNTFDNCNYGNYTWGKACIGVGSGIYEQREVSRYHRNVVVENNRFNVFDPRIANIYCIDGFTFKGNTIEPSNEYKHIETETRDFIVENCDNVNIQK